MNNLIFWISILLLFFLWTVLYKELFLDITRFRLFRLRNRLFELVDQHESLCYDSEVYITLESMINRFIRFAHEIDLPKTLFIQPKSKNTRENVYILINELDNSEIRKDLMSIYYNFSAIIIIHLILNLYVI